MHSASTHMSEDISNNPSEDQNKRRDTPDVPTGRVGNRVPKVAIRITGVRWDCSEFPFPEVLVRVQLVTRSWSYRCLDASILSLDG